MDPIESWVDRDELRRLADALVAPAEEPAPQGDDATFGAEFVGFGAEGPPAPTATASPGAATPEAGPEQVARNALAHARAIAQRGGLMTNNAPPPAEPPEELGPTAQLTEVTPVSGVGAAPVPTPFVARLQAYGTWLREGIQARAFFVTDRDGGILIDEVGSPKLQLVARTLAQASRAANRQAGMAAIGNLHVKIAPDSVLEVVPVTTRYGPLILGMIVLQPLSPRNVETVARGLQQVIDGASSR